MPKGVLYNYYPDPSYIKKKWKPAQIPAESLQALANAEVAAVRHGILSPNVAQNFLPNALAEGYTGGPATITYDKGVKVDEYGELDENDLESPQRQVGLAPVTAPSFGADSLGYDGPDIRRNLQLMGLTVGSGTSDKNLAFFPARSAQKNYPASAAEYFPMNPDDAVANAKFNAVILAKKAALYGENMAVQRWNGAGPGALNHARKVGVLSQMLSHPANKAILDAYLKMKYPE